MVVAPGPLGFCMRYFFVFGMLTFLHSITAAALPLAALSLGSWAVPVAQGSVPFPRPAAVLCLFFRTTLSKSRGLLESDVVTLHLNPADSP